MDGSSRGNPSPAGIGGIGRDSLGTIHFLFSICKGCHTNNLMEALAILFVVERACDLGWSTLICESDSQVVVNLLTQQHSTDVSWQLSLVVNQILHLCDSLVFVSFKHIPREWNGVADCLTKWTSEHMHNWYIVDKGQLPLDLSH
ncbi:uncharacterized protein LOC131859298 [Cryptomeria japonica]|uniref:uncharacterized protein LOC131859298 n=1 Tax=Cryptomeria japonica TaxID=3369 RepID=UPI0027DA178E|nr:uncharacterized protein LOC131859298 [Cryptomeria japonica]